MEVGQPYLCSITMIFFYLKKMRTTYFQILFSFLLVCMPNVVSGKDVSPKRVYLTFQSENGSFKQVNEIDGTISIYFKILDIINVNSILLNGSDVTLELVKNHYSLPTLTENATLDITFEIIPTDFYQKNYNTISYQAMNPAP